MRTPVFDLVLAALLIWLGATRYREGERAWGTALIGVAIACAAVALADLLGRLS